MQSGFVVLAQSKNSLSKEGCPAKKIGQYLLEKVFQGKLLSWKEVICFSSPDEASMKTCQEIADQVLDRDDYIQDLYSLPDESFADWESIFSIDWPRAHGRESSNSHSAIPEVRDALGIIGFQRLRIICLRAERPWVVITHRTSWNAILKAAGIKGLEYLEVDETKSIFKICFDESAQKIKLKRIDLQ